MGRVLKALGERGLADLGQGTSDVALKNNDDYQKNGTQEGIQNPIQGDESKLFGTKICKNDNSDTGQHLRCSGPPDNEQDPVDDEPDYQDVEKIMPA